MDFFFYFDFQQCTKKRFKKIPLIFYVILWFYGMENSKLNKYKTLAFSFSHSTKETSTSCFLDPERVWQIAKINCRKQKQKKKKGNH